jgi:23S rRNA pseudouridine1911/1915/1917 synthase
VLERFGYVTLILANWKRKNTSRSFKHIGHTLFNDERYGGHLILKELRLQNTNSL